MFSEIERYIRLLPLFAGMAAILGTLYNFFVIAGFGSDLFYTLSYVDHINSALLAFGVITLISLVLELVAVLAFQKESFFALEMSTKWLFVTFVAFVGAVLSMYAIGYLDIGNVRGGLGFILPFFSIVFLRKAITQSDFTAFALSFVVMASVSIWSGLDWTYAAKQGDTKYLIATEKSNVLAKGIKPFKDFTFIIDHEGKAMFVKTGEIRTISEK